MRHAVPCPKRRRLSARSLLLACAFCTALGLTLLSLSYRSVEPPPLLDLSLTLADTDPRDDSVASPLFPSPGEGSLPNGTAARSCATVEEMGEVFAGDGFLHESLRVRRLIRDHFLLNGAENVRAFGPEDFCRHGFVMGKTSEAGFGNEMYKVLTAAALSVMLNRSLIIGQTRGKYPFGEYISYSNISFTLREVKHLWRHNGCLKKYGRELTVRVEDFEKPGQSNVLCSNWIKWKQPIIWFQNTTDAVAAQFFLKNVHPDMRKVASRLYGNPEDLNLRPNVFGELMRILISPSSDVKEAINWFLRGGQPPDVSLHMRMMVKRSVPAALASLNCIRRVVDNLHLSKARVVVVSDTPSFVESISPNISEFAEVLHFDYNHFRGNLSLRMDNIKMSDFRSKDWGPAPRWVAFVDFFLASRAKYAVVAGAYRRVGTTYAQLVASLAAANSIEDNATRSSFSFLSSFQYSLLFEGLKNQIGWGHVWNRFAGPLSCRRQRHQCASTPLLPPAWWDGLWQSPIHRDIRRLAAYGVTLSSLGTVDEDALSSFCRNRKEVVRTVPAVGM
ncbi:hypothetical protein MLD38_022605 [Melastoma candidum]|uniref:Uncharacterized protein n=1 Tax=Melastoma candidum TaxID=119954 RepID=A0ACB9QL01_9MYRT|nr:hypothetical protein MLD38_022605 [Melastoma candidum]